MKLIPIIANWLPMLAWMAAIYFLSDQPSTKLPDLGFWDLLFKKGAHFTAYAILALLASRALGVDKRPYLLALIVTILYAAADEFHQTYVPGRNGTVWDVLLDTTGAVTGLLALRYWLKRQPQPPATLMSDPP